LGDGLSISIRTLLGEHGVAFLTGTLKERELLEMGVSIGAPLEILAGGIFIGKYE
jgi:hypothetical protein